MAILYHDEVGEAGAGHSPRMMREVSSIEASMTIDKFAFTPRTQCKQIRSNSLSVDSEHQFCAVDRLFYYLP